MILFLFSFLIKAQHSISQGIPAAVSFHYARYEIRIGYILGRRRKSFCRCYHRETERASIQSRFLLTCPANVWVPFCRRKKQQGALLQSSNTRVRKKSVRKDSGSSGNPIWCVRAHLGVGCLQRQLNPPGERGGGGGGLQRDVNE